MMTKSKNMCHFLMKSWLLFEEDWIGSAGMGGLGSKGETGGLAVDKGVGRSYSGGSGLDGTKTSSSVDNVWTLFFFSPPGKRYP